MHHQHQADDAGNGVQGARRRRSTAVEHQAEHEVVPDQLDREPRGEEAPPEEHGGCGAGAAAR